MPARWFESTHRSTNASTHKGNEMKPETHFEIERSKPISSLLKQLRAMDGAADSTLMTVETGQLRELFALLFGQIAERSEAIQAQACVNAQFDKTRIKSEAALALANSKLNALRRVNDELASALRKYQRAGFGNSTDHFAQGEARDVAIAILAKLPEGR